MDTRITVLQLLDYEFYYGNKKSYSDAQAMIRDIPSSTLLNYIAGFNANLYLNENTDNSGKVQFSLVSSLLNKCETNAQSKWSNTIQIQAKKGLMPIMFWNYSNLLFYGLIFDTYNTLAVRDIRNEEAQKLFDAYLVINSIANNKVKIEKEELNKATKSSEVEKVVLPNFIYQGDYVSTTDFSNQLTKGAMFFEYLEQHPKYGLYVTEFYKSKHVSGFKRMFRNLLVLFHELGITSDNGLRKQLINLHGYVANNEIDLKFIDTLCINSEIITYKPDSSFKLLRNQFLFKVNIYEFLILDVNFLIDKFYKNQVFDFNTFLNERIYKNNFLSDKAKEFTEGIYLPKILDACFPNYYKFYNEKCLNSSNKELCDAYLRESNKICLIECKDTLLNAKFKDNTVKQNLFAELDKKFVANQLNAPKGITQLVNAITDIENHSISFDEDIPNANLEIYPILIYTDSTFGADGVNKVFKVKFRDEINKLNLKKLKVNDVFFINLNFFELHQDYLSGKLIDLFNMLDEYTIHTTDVKFNLTPFEVFSKFYMERNVSENLEPSSFHRQLMMDIVSAI